MEDSEAAKNILLGKSCDTCVLKSFNGDSKCIRTSNEGLIIVDTPDINTCERWHTKELPF